MTNNRFRGKERNPYDFLRHRKLKKLDNQPAQQQQQQLSLQQQQTQDPIINANKENLLTRTNKQHYHHDDHQSGGFDYSSSIVSPASNSKKSSTSPRTSSPINHDKTRSTLRATPDQTSKIHVDVTQNPSDKLLLICDSSEPSPRDLTDTVLSSLPTHKVRRSFDILLVDSYPLFLEQNLCFTFFFLFFF